MKLLVALCVLFGFSVVVPLVFMANGTLTFDQARNLMFLTAAPLLGILGFAVGVVASRR